MEGVALFGGGRVPKDHQRVVAYGGVDELNSILGWALTEVVAAQTSQRLAQVQHDLFALGSALATPPARPGRQRPAVPPLPAARVPEMENWIDEMDRELPPLERFVIPGGAPGAAALHMARTACRRAERSVVTLASTEEVDPEIVRYLNRLSDLLFVCARLENARVGRGDIPWEPA